MEVISWIYAPSSLTLG